MEDAVDGLIVPEDTIMEESVAADLGSQSLDDLGVSVMDQDILERNVAAQVRLRFNHVLTTGRVCSLKTRR